MNILFITHYYDPDSGAAANRLTQLARGLARRGHNVTVLTTMPHYPKGVIPEGYRNRWTVIEDRDGVRVVQIWLWATTSPKIIWRLLSQISFMLALMLRGVFVQRPDVIFIENQPIFTGVAGWFISKIKRRRYVLNVSDYWPEYLYVSGTVSQHSLVYRLFERLANLTQQQAGHIVILWPGLRQGIESRLKNPPPIELVYNAVDIEQFQGTAARFRQQYNLGDKRLVTFLGVLGPHIDLETMLATARALADYDVTVLFVGTGAQKETLAAALAQPEYAHCRRIEWIDQPEVPGFWIASHITYWALHDNPLDKMRFQAKLYEALGSGTSPVIAVNGLMSDFLAETETGLAVPPGKADALTAAIVRLLDDDAAYADMSARARTYAEANFDRARQIDAYERVLTDIANQ